MNFLRQYFFHLIVVVFIAVSMAGGWYVWSTFESVQSGLPVNILKSSRNLSGYIQTISNLAEKLGQAQTDASRANLDELTISLDAVFIAEKSMNIKSLTAELQEIDLVKNEISILMDSIENLLDDAPPLDDLRARLLHTRLIYALSQLQNSYLAVNERTFLTLTKQSRTLGQLKDNTLFLMGIIGAGIMVVLILLMKSNKTNASLNKARNELAHQTGLQQAMLESIDQGFAVWDADDRLVIWNDSCIDFWYNPKDVSTGIKRIDLLRHLAKAGSFGEGDSEEMAEQKLQWLHDMGRDSDEHLTLKDGRHVHLRHYPMPDGGTASVYTDITERKKVEQQLKESERLLVTAINHISDGFVLCDSENRIIMFNNKFRNIYPNSRDLINRGFSFEDFVRGGAERGEYPDAEGRIDEWMVERMSRGRERSESFDQKLIGDRWVQISIGKLPDGGWVGIHVDITPLKEAKDFAEIANQAKSDFLSSMSHELRTPLNAILGFGQMLEYNPNEPLTVDQKDSVNQIMKGGQHLLELINDVLDLAKVEAGKVDLSMEDVSVKSVLDECLALIQTMAEDRGIEVIVGDGFEVDAEIRTDQIRFKQALLNLMSNAVKYNKENGSVTLNCHKTPGAMLHISVTDTGEGVPEDMYDALFQPFNRLGAENTEIEGTGIGLTITKQLIERMDGYVGVESEVGTGSTFWIELPRVGARLIQTLSSTDGNSDEGVKVLPEVEGTILYVEDNPANLKLMEMIIARVEGLSMISAHNAELGIELAKKEMPDMIILDINLPGMNGFEALAKLLTLRETKNIPVIALSANAMPKDIEKGIEAGFKRYLTKPIKVEEVVDVIKECIEL